MITLPPAAQPLVVTMTIDVNATPYFMEWYTDNATLNEDPGVFLVRMIGPSIVDYHAGKTLKVAQAEFQATQKSIQDEVQTIKATL